MEKIPVSEIGWVVRKFAKSNESYNTILPDPDQGTWMAGGCRILAEALRRVVVPPTILLAVVDRGEIQHVVVGLPSGNLIDADGVHTEKHMLAKMIKYEFNINPKIAPVSHKELDKTVIPYSQRQVRMAADLLVMFYLRHGR